eukprot:gb/GEZN01012666.1/.p1 GENE.gb/GEZN01012666.1/~~gb/GEZN01012666.1/.p1  ORF type:complete len:229 (-),score=34.18 gb/GEZN01012666.1/:306-992(-)
MKAWRSFVSVNETTDLPTQPRPNRIYHWKPALLRVALFFVLVISGVHFVFLEDPACPISSLKLATAFQGGGTTLIILGVGSIIPALWHILSTWLTPAEIGDDEVQNFYVPHRTYVIFVEFPIIIYRVGCFVNLCVFCFLAMMAPKTPSCMLREQRVFIGECFTIWVGFVLHVCLFSAKKAEAKDFTEGDFEDVSAMRQLLPSQQDINHRRSSLLNHAPGRSGSPYKVF